MKSRILTAKRERVRFRGKIEGRERERVPTYKACGTYSPPHIRSQGPFAIPLPNGLPSTLPGLPLLRSSPFAAPGFAPGGLRLGRGRGKGIPLLQRDTGDHEHAGLVLLFKEEPLATASPWVSPDFLVRLCPRVECPLRVFGPAM